LNFELDEVLIIRSIFIAASRIYFDFVYDLFCMFFLASSSTPRATAAWLIIVLCCWCNG
jgi:hypothetical protein